MIKWFLVLLLWDGSQVNSLNASGYDMMEDCFAAREEIVEKMGRPIVNYQVVCVQVK